MTIQDICQRDVDTCMAHESVQVAAQRMNARAVGTLVVIDSEVRPIGILTDRDIAIRAVGLGRDAHRTAVTEIMTPDVETVREHNEVESTLALMRANAIRRLPVVNDQGQLVGVVSLDDILTLLAREFQELGRLLSKEKPKYQANL